MFSVKHHIDKVTDIPAHWIFENYLGLDPLVGQSVRIRSIFNPSDRTPSMFLYYFKEQNAYRYKCFSTGKSGSAIELMMYMWGIPFAEAAKRISDDYVAFLKTGKRCETRIVEHSTWKVADYVVRGWTQDDADFWSAYNISSSLLNDHIVKPIQRYVMSKRMIDGIQTQEFTVTGRTIYGYFMKDGTLYKIYQPMNKDRKFIKVCNYLQGSEQLTDNEVLIIVSSLKDMMSLKSLANFNCDMIAPDSENTMISEDRIKEFKLKYKKVITIMDSDEAGVKSMKAYESKYKLPYVYIPQEKDISDLVKIKGKHEALRIVLPGITRALDKYVDLNLENVIE
jgi:5S rRNA maturation endonuclease (ribonuclease M5)